MTAGLDIRTPKPSGAICRSELSRPSLSPADVPNPNSGPRVTGRRQRFAADWVNGTTNSTARPDTASRDLQLESERHSRRIMLGARNPMVKRDQDNWLGGMVPTGPAERTSRRSAAAR